MSPRLARSDVIIRGAGGGGGTNHNILSATHPDSLAAAVVRGDVIVGNATPAWARLAVGAAARYLRSDGSDPLWNVLAAADLSGTVAIANGGTAGATAVAARGNLGNAFMLMPHFWWNAVNPADSTTYYLSILGSLITSETHRTQFIIPGACQIARFTFWAHVAGTLGSAETATITLRVNAVDTALTFSQAFDAANVGPTSSPGAITLAADDKISVSIGTPAWVTNPTNVVAGYSLRLLDNQ